MDSAREIKKLGELLKEIKKGKKGRVVEPMAPEDTFLAVYKDHIYVIERVPAGGETSFSITVYDNDEKELGKFCMDKGDSLNSRLAEKLEALKPKGTDRRGFAYSAGREGTLEAC